MHTFDLLVLLAISEAVGILVLAVLLCRQQPACHQAQQERWRVQEQHLLKVVRMLKRELVACKKNEASLREVSRQRQEMSHHDSPAE